MGKMEKGETDNLRRIREEEGKRGSFIIIIFSISPSILPFSFILLSSFPFSPHFPFFLHYTSNVAQASRL